MTTEQERIDQQRKVKEVLNKNLPLMADDLQTLRESAGIVAYLTSNHDPIAWRMEIEFLDAVRKLDESSTRLSTVGNRLAFVATVATVIGVFIAIFALVHR